MTQESPTGEVHALFERALGQPRERRAAFLDQVCAGRPPLRARIEELLRLAEGGEGFLDRSAVRADPSDAPADVSQSAYAAGRTIGAYRLVRPLGRGGMAEVWLAERSEGGFHQQAAVKLIPHARGSLRQRFATEREILAGLAHPSIARLYDGGVEADGTAYMVMEYVEGEHLIAYVQAHRLSLSERLNLFLQIVDAVAYAHTRLVVHRDLKPSNILVTAEGQAKLLDFGIAKLLDADSREDRTRTLYLSPNYAAPEQLTDGALGTATDVYALGVILFELLTSRLPWSDDGAPMATAVKRLLDAPLPPPSKCVTEPSPIHKRALQGDLDAIVGKALRKDASDRYPDARALAEDVRRCLDHRPVQARAGARAYVARRFMRRNWLPLASAALLFVAMAVATIAIAWQADKARSEAWRAEREARTATAVQDFMRDIFRANSSAQSDPAKARRTTARELLDLGAKKIDAAMDDAPEAKLGTVRLLGDLYKDLEIKDEQVTLRRQAVELARKSYGADSPELAASLTELGDALYGTKEEKDGAAVLDEAQAILDRRHDDRSVLRGRLLLKQAQFRRLTDRPRSLDDVRRAADLFEALPPSLDLAEALRLEGNMQSLAANWEDAAASMNKAIDVLRAVPEGRFALARAYGELAGFQMQALDYAEAERNARLALQAVQAVNGERHIETVRKTTTLGQVLFLAGNTRDGLDLLTRAKEQFLALPGADDPTDVAYVVGTRASLLSVAGDLEAGLADIQAVRAALKRDPADVTRAVTISEIARTLTEMGRFEEARKDLEEAASIREAAGQKRTTVAFNPIRETTAKWAMFQGRFAEAQQVIDDFVVPQDPPGQRLQRFAVIRWVLMAELALRSGNVAAVAEPVASLRAAVQASGHAELLEKISTRADFFDGSAKLGAGDAAAALPLLQRALDARIKYWLPMSPLVAEAQITLAECHLALGHAAQAHELAAKAEAIQAQHKELADYYREPLRRLRKRLSVSKSLTAKAV